MTGPVQQTGPREMVVAPGSVILIDEASMLPLDHMLAIMRKATTLGCKVIVAGDQEQLAAVEGGGAMKLLSQRLGYVKLTEPVRFDSQWERDASLRLRQGDDTVLEEYDAEGRFRSGGSVAGSAPEARRGARRAICLKLSAGQGHSESEFS